MIRSANRHCFIDLIDFTTVEKFSENAEIFELKY